MVQEASIVRRAKELDAFVRFLWLASAVLIALNAGRPERFDARFVTGVVR